MPHAAATARARQLRSRLPARLVLLAAATLCALAAAPLRAQPAATVSGAPGVAAATHPPSAEDLALLQAFGQRAGLGRLADDLVERLRLDARIGAFFKDTKPAHLKRQLADQFCAVLNGPCVYDGETMKNSHADLKISRGDFLALVELLQAAMAAQQIPFAAQNRLLARLAPMHREIITLP